MYARTHARTHTAARTHTHGFSTCCVARSHGKVAPTKSTRGREREGERERGRERERERRSLGAPRDLSSRRGEGREKKGGNGGAKGRDERYRTVASRLERRPVATGSISRAARDKRPCPVAARLRYAAYQRQILISDSEHLYLDARPTDHRRGSCIIVRYRTYAARCGKRGGGGRR